MPSLFFYAAEDTADALETLNLGTVAESSSDDTALRIANADDTYQAQNVTVGFAGSAAGQLWLSSDGDVFTDSLSVGDIAPGGSSETFWLRRVTPTGAAAGNAMLVAIPAAWTNTFDDSTSTNVGLDTD